MVKAGLAGDRGAGAEDIQAACLEAWAATMQQDLILAQALLSHPLGPSDDLTASLRNVLGHDQNGNSYMTRCDSALASQASQSIFWPDSQPAQCTGS